MVVGEKMLERHLPTGELGSPPNLIRLHLSLAEIQVPATHWAVLKMTYDGAKVYRSDWQRASADVRNWIREVDICGDDANRWQWIADQFEFAAQLDVDEDSIVGYLKAFLTAAYDFRKSPWKEPPIPKHHETDVSWFNVYSVRPDHL